MSNMNQQGAMSIPTNSENVDSKTVEEELEHEDHSSYASVNLEMKEHEDDHAELGPDGIQVETINDSNSPDAYMMISNEELVGMIFERSENTEQNEEVTNEEDQEMEEDNQDCVEMVPPKAEIVFFRRMDKEASQYLKSVVVKMEMKVHEDDNAELVPDDIQAETINDFNSPDASLNDGNIQCRVCNGYFNASSMTETPSDPEEMKK